MDPKSIPVQCQVLCSDKARAGSSVRPGRKCYQAWSGRVEPQPSRLRPAAVHTALFLKDEQPELPGISTVATSAPTKPHKELTLGFCQSLQVSPKSAQG
jgi:hypothetical protein